MDLNALLVAVMTSPVFVPAMTAAATALGVKWLDGRAIVRKASTDEALAMRSELRGEITDLRGQLAQERRDSSEYRTRWLEQQQQVATLQTTIISLQAQVTALTARLGDLQRMTGDRRHPPVPVEPPSDFS